MYREVSSLITNIYSSYVRCQSKHYLYLKRGFYSIWKDRLVRNNSLVLIIHTAALP